MNKGSFLLHPSCDPRRKINWRFRETILDPRTVSRIVFRLRVCMHIAPLFITLLLFSPVLLKLTLLSLVVNKYTIWQRYFVVPPRKWHGKYFPRHVFHSTHSAHCFPHDRSKFEWCINLFAVSSKIGAVWGTKIYIKLWSKSCNDIVLKILIVPSIFILILIIHLEYMNCVSLLYY